VEQLLEHDPVDAGDTSGISIWRGPSTWLLKKKLCRGFWVFFAVECFVDFGFSLYFFLFNLYLVDCHFNERTIGLVGGVLTFGSVAGTLPAGWLARKVGLRPLQVCSMIAAPLLGVTRVFVLREPAQVALAFLSGLALCIWAVCYLPTLARLTTSENRASAFSIIFSVGIAVSALGGLVCGSVPHLLRTAGYTLEAADVKRLILIGSCVIAGIGVFPLLRLRLPPPEESEAQTPYKSEKKVWKINPFLLGFVPLMALWTATLASFTPFANVYLTRDFHISLSQIGFIFSAAHVIQLCATLMTPVVFRRLGLLNGIVATQVATAVTMGLLAGAHNRGLAVALYLGFSAAQWMSTPGLYNMLMSRVTDEERSSASAMTMFSNALLQSCAMAGAGILFVRFGYPRVLVGIAGMALIAALLFKSFDMPGGRKSVAN
jgi:predicted MFS family arabinose efflux permease